MASGFIDAFTSPTLKYLREHWWNDAFAEFLTETLRPRAGNRILDVGCGEGIAVVQLGRLHVSQMRLVGVDLMVERVVIARRETAAHNQRVLFASADACHLPFRDGAFDSTFCVAVLQHINDVERAIRDFARVTRVGGRVVAVEPDNSARYYYSSMPAGRRAFELSARFFSTLVSARGEAMDAAIGPKLPTLFSACGIEPLDVRLFPVTQTQLGAFGDEVWRRRHDVVEQMIDQATHDDARKLGREYLTALAAYAAEASRAGSSFVEIQHTMLFATVGQKTED